MSNLDHLIRDVISGRAVPVPGDEVDTDRIIPARFLKEVTFEKMGEYLFMDARFNEDGSEKEHPLNESCYKGSEIMVVGKNFGCGSSREHAPQAIMRHGFRALIGESFAEIFSGNCKALGIPVVTASQEIIETLTVDIAANSDQELTVNLESETVSFNGEVYAISISKERKQSFLTGTWDELAQLKSNSEAIQKTVNNLPYFKNFHD